MSRDPRTWMWAEAVELMERADRLHRQFFRFVISPARHPAWEPPVDIFETDRELKVLVALPGVHPSQLQVGLDSGVLIIAGSRPMPAESRGASIQRLEIPQGRFERRIELPPGDFEFDRQELSHGCLLLNLRKL